MNWKKSAASMVWIWMIVILASYAQADEWDPLYRNHMLDSEKLAPPVVERALRKKMTRSTGTPPTGTWEKKSVGTVTGDLKMKHTVWESARPPYGPFDRIALHRVVKHRSRPRGCKNQPPVFIIPGTWEAGGWSKIADKSINPFLYLADEGYDVFTMSFRSANIPNMAYEQFNSMGVDISGTLDWTYGTFREDIKACVDKIKRVANASRIFMAGFSRGSTLMYIYASKYQQDLKGLITLDGDFKKYPPNPDNAVDEETFNYIMELVRAGALPVPDDCTHFLCPPIGTYYQYLSEASWDYYDSWQLAAVVPNAQLMAGGPLSSGFEIISDFVADDAYYMWGDGVFCNYYQDSMGRETLITAMTEFSRYWPTVQDFEHYQLMAYEDVPYLDYDDNEINLPAIAFLTQNYCPAGMCLGDTFPNITKSDDVTIHYLPDYGHLDVVFGTNALADIKQPLVDWLNRHQ